MSKEHFTILIQGPINKNSLSNIKNYKKFGKVIVSYWDTDEKFEKDPEVLYLSNPLPDRSKATGILKDSTFYWAICSTYHGIIKSKTKYTIKVRSDEYYTDLSPIVEKIKEKKNTIVCGNIFVRNDFEYSFHFGDHIFGGATNVLKSAYKDMFDYQHAKKQIPDWAIQGKEGQCAEAVLGKAFLLNLNKEVPLLYNQMIEKYSDKTKIIDACFFYDKFFVIDINKLGDYEVKWNSPGRTWGTKNGDKFINHHRISKTAFDNYFNPILGWLNECKKEDKLIYDLFYDKMNQFYESLKLS